MHMIIRAPFPSFMRAGKKQNSKLEFLYCIYCTKQKENKTTSQDNMKTIQDQITTLLFKYTVLVPPKNNLEHMDK